MQTCEGCRQIICAAHCIVILHNAPRPFPSIAENAALMMLLLHDWPVCICTVRCFRVLTARYSSRQKFKQKQECSRGRPRDVIFLI